MNKLKDLFYDFNDILVAAIIIAVAGLIISWRVGVIMSYPQYAAAKAKENSTAVDFSGVDLTPEPVEEFNAMPDDIQSEPAVDDQAADSGAQKATLDENGSYIVEIPKGSSAYGIAKLLKEQGIISNEDAFMEKAEEMGATLKMKYGTYRIPKGSSAEEIINKLI